MENMNVLDMIRQGWLATYPLIVLSVVSLTVIGERLWAFRGMIGTTAALTRTIYADVSRGDIGTALGLVVAIVALIFYNYFQVRLDRMDAALTIGGARLIEALRLERSAAEPALERVADGRR